MSLPLSFVTIIETFADTVKQAYAVMVQCNPEEQLKSPIINLF